MLHRRKRYQEMLYVRRKADLGKSGLLFGVMLLLFTAGVALTGCGASKVKTAEIVNQQTDYRVNPVGIDDPVPVFSWQMSSDEKDKSQSVYRITVMESGNTDIQISNTGRENGSTKEYSGLTDSFGECVWDSGRVESDLSVAIPYGGEPLKPQTRYGWTVEVWDEDGNLCSTSGEAAYFETGLMGEFPEEAHWISVGEEYGETEDDTDRRTFQSVRSEERR